MACVHGVCVWCACIMCMVCVHGGARGVCVVCAHGVCVWCVCVVCVMLQPLHFGHEPPYKTHKRLANTHIQHDPTNNELFINLPLFPRKSIPTNPLIPSETNPVPKLNAASG